MRARATVTTAALVTLTAAGVAATALRTGDAPAGHDTSPPPATATVTRQTLLDRQNAAGKLGHGDPIELAPRLSGTVTAIPTIGAVITRNHVLYRIDDAPVLLLFGAMPAYRTLAPGLEGTDVRQLERNLWDLGYRGFTADNAFTADTAAAVRRWQKDVGLARTGTVELGRVLFEPGPIRIDGQSAVPGDPAAPGQGILTYTGTARIVTVELAMSDQRLATTGTPVTVELPTGKAAPGRITAVRTVLKPAEGSTKASTKLQVDVAVDDERLLDGLDQAAVTVQFTAAERRNVLTVPVSALLARADGGYGVQTVEDGRTRLVAVQTGLFADGRVEVTGDGLTEGMVVGVPS